MTASRSCSTLSLLTLALAVASFASARAAENAAGVDQAFVAKVSQGGMFEVELGKVAAERGASQEIKDNGVTEAHDHALVGARLKAVAAASGIQFDAKLNGEFQGKLDTLRALSGPAFDKAYVIEMERIHGIDGGLFAQEAKAGGTDALRSFAEETHSIVGMHIGALKGTDVR